MYKPLKHEDFSMIFIVDMNNINKAIRDIKKSIPDQPDVMIEKYCDAIEVYIYKLSDF